MLHFKRSLSCNTARRLHGQALGATMVQLQSVNDAMHAPFYGKHNYGDVKSLVPKVNGL